MERGEITDKMRGGHSAAAGRAACKQPGQPLCLQAAQGQQRSQGSSAAGTGRLRLGHGNTPALDNLAQVTSFGAWLPGHCGLVSELDLRVQGPHAVAGSLQPGWAAAAQVVTCALQLCSSRSAAPGHAAAALQLKAFFSDFVHSPAALRSLASCSSLVRMAVPHVPQQHLTSAFFDALGSLTSLTLLWFSPASASTALPAGFVATLGRLTRLQTLRIAIVGLHPASLALLPASLTELWLPAEHAAGSSADIALIHIRRLRQLLLNIPTGLSAASQLPAGLHQLTLIGPEEAVGGLQQLRWLELTQPQHVMPLLARLRELPHLQGLKAKLGDCQPDEVGAVVAAIAAATRLTHLQLYSTDASQEEDEDNVINFSGQMLHRHLRQLRKLRVLHLSAFGSDRVDAVHLTALSLTLTDLKLSSCHISDLAVAAMLQRLTGLRRLKLNGLGLSNPLLWVTVASLTNLQSLKFKWMDPGAGLAPDTLHLLSALTSLTHLSADTREGDEGEPLITPGMQDDFMANMPLLRECFLEVPEG